VSFVIMILLCATAATLVQMYRMPWILWVHDSAKKSSSAMRESEAENG